MCQPRHVHILLSLELSYYQELFLLRSQQNFVIFSKSRPDSLAPMAPMAVTPLVWAVIIKWCLLLALVLI